MSSQSPVTFVVCVEPGPHRLEQKAAALFMTMRRHMGALSSAPVWAYAPRPGHVIAPWCRDLMDHFEIRLIDDPLNTAHSDYPLANKPIALAHAEEHASTEYVVFLDSDILVWREPREFLLPEGIDISLVPDTTKTTASAGPADVFETYWTALYELVGATARPFVTTLLTRERVRGTWNSGVIPLRRTAQIAAKWRDGMKSLLANDFAPQDAFYLRENNLLSAVATAHYERFKELSFSYNYQVQNWDRMTALGIAPEDAVVWHYQPFFDAVFRRFAGRIDRARTIRERLALTESLVDDLRRNYRTRIGLDESWVQNVRRRAKLGPKIRRLLGRAKATESQTE